ncbi:MAG: hypothetical protein WAN51_06695, partial [Alphaproteobacteria bacterium]
FKNHLANRCDPAKNVLEMAAALVLTNPNVGFRRKANGSERQDLGYLDGIDAVAFGRSAGIADLGSKSGGR